MPGYRYYSRVWIPEDWGDGHLCAIVTKRVRQSAVGYLAAGRLVPQPARVSCGPTTERASYSTSVASTSPPSDSVSSVSSTAAPAAFLAALAFLAT